MYVLFTTIMVNFLTDELLDGLLKDQGWENSPMITDLNQKSLVQGSSPWIRFGKLVEIVRLQINRMTLCAWPILSLYNLY